MSKPCNCLNTLKRVRNIDEELATERGKLFVIIDHYPECREYPAALDTAVRRANDYPRLQSDFDDAMAMLEVANKALADVRRDMSLSFTSISRALNRTTDIKRTEWVEDYNEYVAKRVASEPPTQPEKVQSVTPIPSP